MHTLRQPKERRRTEKEQLGWELIRLMHASPDCTSVCVIVSVHLADGGSHTYSAQRIAGICTVMYGDIK